MLIWLLLSIKPLQSLGGDVANRRPAAPVTIRICLRGAAAQQRNKAYRLGMDLS